MANRLPALLFIMMVAATARAEAQGASAIPSSHSAGGALFNILTDVLLAGDQEYQALVSVLQRQTTTFPIGSSSGGFSYTFDPQIGLPVRRTRSFGPMFADRPMTAGRHKLSANLAFQQTSWRALAGVDLRKGLNINFITPVEDSLTGHPETDFGVTRMTFRTSRTIFGATYGLTDKWDVGVLVPYGQATVSGHSDYTVTDLVNHKTVLAEHYDSAGASAGLGDIIARGKYEFMRRPSIDLAAGLDVRLPTGDKDAKLLGAGATQTKLALIGTVAQGSFSPHFNVGYTFVPGSIKIPPYDDRVIAQPDEFNYTVGADVVLGNAVTVSADLIGRSLFKSFNFVRTVDVFETSLSSEPGTVNLLLGAVGGKVMVAGGWLLNLSVAFPMNNAGLKPSVTPVIGFERAF